jgi:hypothetical protein
MRQSSLSLKKRFRLSKQTRPPLYSLFCSPALKYGLVGDVEKNGVCLTGRKKHSNPESPERQASFLIQTPHKVLMESKSSYRNKPFQRIIPKQITASDGYFLTFHLL